MCICRHASPPHTPNQRTTFRPTPYTHTEREHNNSNKPSRKLSTMLLLRRGVSAAAATAAPAACMRRGAVARRGLPLQLQRQQQQWGMLSTLPAAVGSGGDGGTVGSIDGDGWIRMCVGGWGWEIRDICRASSSSSWSALFNLIPTHATPNKTAGLLLLRHTGGSDDDGGPDGGGGGGGVWGGEPV